jgi:choline kinase
VTGALILAAGRGTRLGADVAGRPKCLTDVAGRAIIDWQLDALAANSIRDVVIVTGFEAQQVISHVTRRQATGQFAFTFVNNDRFAETNVLTSWFEARAVLRDAYVYMHGDTIFEPELVRRLLVGADDQQLTLTVDTHPCADEEMKVAVDGNRVRLISKQMPPHEALGEFTGVMHVPRAAQARLAEATPALLASPTGNKMFVEAAIQHLIDVGGETPRLIDITGLRWREIDFPEDLAAARTMFSGTPAK